MTIPVQQSLEGFIASDADVSFTDAGLTMVHLRVGVEQWRREQDGAFTEQVNSFHDLLISGHTAERAAARFRQGDQVIAHRSVGARYAEPPARLAERAVYLARTIGHDLARTTEGVDRAPAAARQDPDQLDHAAGAVNPLPADALHKPTAPAAGAYPTAPRPGRSTGPAIGA